MKALFFLLPALLTTFRINAQNKKPDFESSVRYVNSTVNPAGLSEGINKRKSHIIHINYGYESLNDWVSGVGLYHWKINSAGLGYLFALTRNTNIGVFGRYTSFITDEKVMTDWSAGGNQSSTYKFSTSSLSILFKSQFFWYNRSPYIGLYSGLDFGVRFVKPLSSELISGNINPYANYHGDLFRAQVDGGWTLIGTRFCFSENSHWYFYAEFGVSYGAKFTGGIMYRF